LRIFIELNYIDSGLFTTFACDITKYRCTFESWY